MTEPSAPESPEPSAATSHSTVLELLDRFLERANSAPFEYEACHHFPGRGVHTRHVVVGFVIHGNEHGSLPAALAIQEKLLASPPAGPVTLLIGNVDAVHANVRYLDEDFNRVFTFDRPAVSRERQRAERVRPILDSADVFFDLHQTQTASAEGFYTMPWSQVLGAYARITGGASVGLTRRPDEAFSTGLRCLDEYVRDRGKVAFTLELGQRGQNRAQADAAEAAILRLFNAVDALQSGATLEALASAAPPITWYETAYVAKHQGPTSALRPGLYNWLRVTQGELLSPPSAPPIVAPCDGVTLFPKYPDPGEAPPPELVRVARPIGDPSELFGAGLVLS